MKLSDIFKQTKFASGETVVPTNLPLEHTPSADACQCASILSDALKSAGHADTHEHHQTIVDSVDNPASTAGDPRGVHNAIFHTIFRLGRTGAKPTAVTADTPEGIFHRRADNVELLEKVVPEHGSIENAVDYHMKHGGLTPEDAGITGPLGETYLASQQSANQTVSDIMGANTTTTTKSDLTPDTCEVCTRHAMTLDRLYDAYIDSENRISPKDGTAKAWKNLASLEAGHIKGERLPERGTHDYLLRIQSELDDWRGSGHLYGDEHDKPGTGYFSRFPAVLAEKEFGSGQRWPAALEGLYRRAVHGTGVNRVTIRRKQDKTLQAAWQYLIGESKGDKDIDGWMSDQGNINRLFELEKHWRDNGASHLADKFVKRTPVTYMGEDGTRQPTNKTRYEFNTGRRIISVIQGDRLPDGPAGKMYTPTKVASLPLPDQTVGILPYQEQQPYFNDFEQYVLLRGLGLDMDKMERKPVSEAQSAKLPCRGRLEKLEGESTTDPVTGKRTDAYVAKAYVPSLIPDDASVQSKYPTLAEHECTEHDGHEHDPDTGRVTAILMKKKRLIKPEQRESMSRLLEQALENIDPAAYARNRDNHLINVGAQHARFLRGETDINNVYVGEGADPGTTGERPRFSPGSADLLGTSAEVKAREESKARKRKDNKNKRTREK